MRNLIDELIDELLAHYRDLRRHLTRELRDPHSAADIAQSSFERVYAQVLEARGGTIESPKALLFKIARNLCIDDARKRKVAGDWAHGQGDADSRVAAPSSEYLAAQRQVLERVIDALEKLPPLRREVFILFRAHGCTRIEIAAQLKLTEAAVAKHLVRAAIDCSRVFADLRSALIEPQSIGAHAGFDGALAEDFP